ncbi:MAG: hypothetical protein IGS38_00890 [Synechococcales cyanobacterium M58_A2018_015]|nr:hypothetical protein [Synechococcales cyanobacterium M58_A2018_015]
MTETRILVAIKDEFLGQLPKVCHRLQSAGMSINDVLSTVGTITGSIDSENLATLRTIEGVASVEQEEEFFTS